MRVSDTIGPARVFIPAGIALLVGMMARMGWIDGAALHGVWTGITVTLTLLLLMAIVAIPFLLMGLAIWLTVRCVAWLCGAIAG